MGRLTKTLNFASDHVREQAQDALDYYAERDRDETEFRARVPQLIRDEKALIDAQLASGRTLLANRVEGTCLIHRASCHTVRHQLDRDIAWEYWLNDEAGQSETFRMPTLVTASEVEQLRRYRACLVCNPDTLVREKKPPRSIRPTALRSMTLRHVGRNFETVDGKFLGELVSYAVSATAITLTFASGVFSGTVDSEVVMLPAHD